MQHPSRPVMVKRVRNLRDSSLICVGHFVVRCQFSVPRLVVAPNLLGPSAPIQCGYHGARPVISMSPAMNRETRILCDCSFITAKISRTCRMNAHACSRLQLLLRLRSAFVYATLVINGYRILTSYPGIVGSWLNALECFLWAKRCKLGPMPHYRSKTIVMQHLT